MSHICKSSEKCLIESFTGTGRFVKFGNIQARTIGLAAGVQLSSKAQRLDDVETRLVWTGQLQCRA
jgi:hypothetical protein